jgi:hypothetical protein
MKQRTIFIIITLALVFAIVGLVVFGVFNHPNPTPNTQYTYITPVHAMRVDYLDMSKSREEVDTLESQMQQAGINMVVLSAGRVDWTYFPWSAHHDSWSSDVRQTGIDFLADDSQRFGKWAHVSAAVDMLAPIYIQNHPAAAALSASGTASKNLVSTMELVDGQFGQDALSLIESTASNYPVNSILISELFYYTDGYGDADKAAYTGYTSQQDWPRAAGGEIDINNPTIGAWRVYEMGRFLTKAASIVHQNNKLLFLEVRVALDENGNVVVENGADFNTFLQYADRLVVWGNHDLNGQPPEAIGKVANFLSKFGDGKVILMLGLWDKLYNPDVPKDQMTAIPPGDLLVMLHSADQAGLQNYWITPSFLMSELYWSVIDNLWGKSPASP